MSVKTRQIDSTADRRKFAKVPWVAHQSDPRWVPPLLADVLDTLNPRKNPFFEHGTAALFVAERDGEAVGRITAHTNRLHNEYHKDKTGFFGFFECIDDQKVSAGLLEAAEAWLRQQGCDKALGPESFSTNEELGLLVEDREGPPMIMCAQNPPYYPGLLEAAGYEKAKDLYGWSYDVGEIPEEPLKIAKAVEKHPGLTVRQADPKNLERDIHIVRDVFNAAWSDNWGYVPWTDSEVRHAAKVMGMIIKPEITAIAEVEGKPAGIMVALPNINEVIKDLDGRLFPTGLLKLIWRVKLGRHKFRSARLFLLGIKPEYRGSVLGGLSVLLYVRAHRGGQKLGIKFGELGWTLEDNEKINAGIQFMGGRLGKVYRIYGKDL
ncbi:MAG: N-acetyltransferase [Gemmatimonadales bacterium]|nr:N-acetyltransferase [Gemmatimonadales bacterium]NIN10351.1 N-acetyltransferase [Gemmatimonadales bacterium]NIN49146.1 N-acetyltransferase [Gemmatimonadales bacterium]NIP06610.1 N-acetyltransferase [Gemmatimonadales bacterium]NIS65432.1 N-acetyltransferase [Gemmatimonadales bacterium]